MAQAVVAMPMIARRMARKRRMGFQRKVASSSYMAERDGRAIVGEGGEGETLGDYWVNKKMMRF